MRLPCQLPPGVRTPSSLTAMWTPPGGGPDLLVAGDNGNFTLQLEAVSLAQAGTYTCHIYLQGQWLSATVTLAVITGQACEGKEWLPTQGTWGREERLAGRRLDESAPRCQTRGTAYRGRPLQPPFLSPPYVKN